MHAATDRLEFAPPATPGLLRSLGLAVLAHVFLLAALTWGVHWKSETVTLSAEAELWSAVPQEAAPKLLEVPPEVSRPAPVMPDPQPARPVPTPPPQVQALQADADIALAQEKMRKKKEKDKAVEKAKELDKQRLEALRQENLKQEKLALQKKAALDKKKTDDAIKRKELLASQQDTQKLEAQRKENLKRIAGLAGAAGDASAKGSALQSSGPSASYAGRIRARIKPNIVFTDELPGNPTAEIEVRTAPDGTIISRKLLKTSGDKTWDEAVLKAIDKTEVLPRDTDGRVPASLIISFRPKD